MQFLDFFRESRCWLLCWTSLSSRGGKMSDFTYFVCRLGCFDIIKCGLSLKSVGICFTEFVLYNSSQGARLWVILKWLWIKMFPVRIGNFNARFWDLDFDSQLTYYIYHMVITWAYFNVTMKKNVVWFVYNMI